MAAKVKVDQIETVDGTGNITLNNSITMASNKTLPAASLTGTVPTASLGSGTASSSVFLRGDGSWQTAGSTSASDLTSGTLPMARLSGTLPALDGSALTNLPGGGKILQVKYVQDTTNATWATSTWTATNCTVAITPATGSKILGIWTQQWLSSNSYPCGVGAKLFRGGTEIGGGDYDYDMQVHQGTSRHRGSWMTLDTTPGGDGSTAITYTVKVASQSGRSVTLNNGGKSQLTLFEIGA